MPRGKVVAAPGYHAIVARGGRIYWIRRMTLAGRQQTVSLPREVLNQINAPEHAFFALWVENGGIRLQVVEPDGRLPAVEKKCDSPQ